VAEVFLDQVGKVYAGEVRAVADASLRIADRESMVLVGPSGCGKSTLLRMIAGLEEISEGTISIGGTVVNAVAPRDRDVAMVFQNYALYPHMNVFANLAFSLKLRKVPRREIETRVRAAAYMLAISHLLDRKPGQLSGGQAQRVAVGRAIVRNPAVFLFDEPLSNLDAQLRAEMRHELSQLHRRLQTTMIFVTHDQVEAMTLGDRLAVMHGGRIQQTGPPLEVYRSPVNRFVAGFLGTPPMNFLTGRVQSHDGKLCFAAGDRRWPIPGAGQTGAGREQDIVFGIRPEHLRLVEGAATEPTPALAELQVEVQDVQHFGNESLLLGRVEGEAVIARVPPGPAVRVGETVRLAVDLAEAHLFDAAGDRLGEG